MVVAQGFVALALVLGLVWLFYRLFLLLQARLGLSGPQRNVRVEERTSLGDKRQLLVVSVEGQRFLLGSTSNQISLVSTLDAKPSYQPQEEESAETKPSPSKPFRELLGEVAL